MELIQLLKRAIGLKSLHQYRQYKGLYLPLTRSNENLSNDDEYVNSAVSQVDELLQYTKLTPNTHILDFGCGQGRFAIGLLVRNPKIGSYCGIDTNAASINWCKRYLQRRPNLTFTHVPAHNARYNPSAKTQPPLPIKANSFDVVFMNSVFSHMLTADVEFYLKQLHEAMREEGIIYTTAFIEEDVPPVEENPKNYLGRKSVGALHRVCYEKSFFLTLVEDAGFSIVDFQHQKFDRTKQSVVVAKKIA